jgi:hypothetical protein
MRSPAMEISNRREGSSEGLARPLDLKFDLLLAVAAFVLDVVASADGNGDALSGDRDLESLAAFERVR